MSLPDYVIPYPDGVYCIDADYVRPGLASCYLLVDSDRLALIDCGTSHTVPRVLELLNILGYDTGQVDYVIPTHVHLDHAGGAGTMMHHFSNATLLVHPSGAKHLIDPARLIDSATSVYGSEGFSRMFGEIEPIDRQRVISPADNESRLLGTRELRFLHTPGHARHHFCVHDPVHHFCFTGDIFGISYPEISNRNGERFLLPTTTPTQFEPQAWLDTLDRIGAQNIKRVYLTHFGQLPEVEKARQYLKVMLDCYAAIGLEHRSETDQREHRIYQALQELTTLELQKHGIDNQTTALELLDMDLRLNAQGLEYWLRRQA